MNIENTFSLTSSYEVDRICLPLKDLNINYFNYLKIYKDGSRDLLTNNAAWINHFYKNGLYNSVGAIDVEHILPKGYFLWCELDQDDYVYSQGRDFFNIDNGISFIFKNEDYTLLYIFGAEKNNSSINNWYIRNIDIFKRFILYFNEQASDLIKKSQINRIYLPEKQIVDTSRRQIIDTYEDKREAFFRKTDIEKFYVPTLKSGYFTRKQAECIAYLVSGLTAKECALKLGISFRTVEEHVKDIKDKIFELTGNKLDKSGLITFLKALCIHDVVFSKKII